MAQHQESLKEQRPVVIRRRTRSLEAPQVTNLERYSAEIATYPNIQDYGQVDRYFALLRSRQESLRPKLSLFRNGHGLTLQDRIDQDQANVERKTERNRADYDNEDRYIERMAEVLFVSAINDGVIDFGHPAQAEFGTDYDDAYNGVDLVVHLFDEQTGKNVGLDFCADIKCGTVNLKTSINETIERIKRLPAGGFVGPKYFRLPMDNSTQPDVRYLLRPNIAPLVLSFDKDYLKTYMALLATPLAARPAYAAEILQRLRQDFFSAVKLSVKDLLDAIQEQDPEQEQTCYVHLRQVYGKLWAVCAKQLAD